MTQKQLNTMRGDRGVILPEGLEYPPDWPEPEPPKAKSKPEQSPQKHSPFVFLSYSSDDRDQISAYHDFFESRGLNVWCDQDISPGTTWRETIAERLENCVGVLTLWTKHSTQSKAVIEEASKAQAARKLLHARLDDAPLPYGFGETQYSDLREWDGTDADPNMARLLQAMRDKLEPPGTDQLASRVQQASPIAYRVVGQKLSAGDTPLNAPAAANNPDDLDQRLTGLFQSADRVHAKVQSGRYNTPEDLTICLVDMQAIRTFDQITWYALDDTRCALMDCIATHDGRASWNDILVGDLDRLSQRVDEIEPLLRPKQVPVGEQGAKPPLPDPNLAGVPDQEIEEVAANLQDILESDEAEAVLDAGGRAPLDRELAHIREGLPSPTNLNQTPDQRKSRLRRGLRGAAMVVGSLVAAITGGVAVNLLTAPDAAVTLGQRLQPILDALLKLFL